MERRRIVVTGRVQGVGFRPAVHRLATSLGLSGFVLNDTRGVTIELQGQGTRIEEFVRRLRNSDKPPLARIESCDAVALPTVEREGEFVIRGSRSGGAVSSEVSADVAVCEDCLGEMDDPADLRYRYPFINCTNCGPRYSIVKTIPYDRPNTTMSGFPMCDRCGEQ